MEMNESRLKKHLSGRDEMCYEEMAYVFSLEFSITFSHQK